MAKLYKVKGNYHKNIPHFTKDYEETTTTDIDLDRKAFNLLPRLEKLARDFGFEIVDILFRRKTG